MNTLDEYQIAAARSAGNQTLAVLGLGIAGEAGEVADMLKKVVGHGHPLDINKLRSELGDVLWYVAMLAKATGLKLSEIAERNIVKLAERYPEGFTSERSITRSEP